MSETGEMPHGWQAAASLQVHAPKMKTSLLSLYGLTLNCMGNMARRHR